MIKTVSFCDNYIDRLIDHIQAEYIDKGADLSRLAIVFGGRRPSLFIKRKLAQKLKGSYFPPQFFTIEDFLSSSLKKLEDFSVPQELEGCYTIYTIAQKAAPELLRQRESFAQFLPWAREIAAFIEQLDLEMVSDRKLLNLKENAQIGYDVPQEINRLLAGILKVRRLYHEHLKAQKAYTRGFQFLRAAELVERMNFDEFDQVIFCNFFYFNASEEALVNSLIRRNKATLLFQGDERKWPVLHRLARRFDCQLREGEAIDEPRFKLSLYSGVDAHAQVAHAREILKSIKDPQNTVIVLPDAGNLIPLLAEITHLKEDFNVSMGYPLKRSSLYHLIDFIFKAQLSRKDGRYYAKDYLKVLRHPFVKNLRLKGDPAITRVLMHKIEEVLTGKEATRISGSLFLDLEDIESLDELYMAAGAMNDRMGLETIRRDLEQAIETVHEVFFRRFEPLTNLKELALALEETLQLLLSRSAMKHYPLNVNIAQQIFQMGDELQSARFRDERFEQEELFRIFENAISRGKVSFRGSPLKGLQILGLQETRSLNFENVIVLDANEGALPDLTLYEPLIPREVLVSLGLDRLELEEEIQRYQFMRLISSAKNVHLIYQESKEHERSRFIEELKWEHQKKARSLDVLEPSKKRFAASLQIKPRRAPKTAKMIEFLKKHVYSASSINTYLRNPYEFYTNYVLGLRESEDLLDEPDGRQIGTFIHGLLEEAYTPFLNKKPTINKGFRTRFERLFERRFEETFSRNMKTDAFLLKSVLIERLKRFLDNEETNPERASGKLLHLEHRCADTWKLSCGNVRFQYIVDRIDQMRDGTVLITDYKTGALDVMPSKLEKLRDIPLTREAISEHIKSFQVPLYFNYMSREFKGKKVNAALYNLRTLKVQKFLDDKNYETADQLNDFYATALDAVMSEILNPAVDFVEEAV